MANIEDWKKLIRMHAESEAKVSIIEMNELAGALLYRDINNGDYSKFENALADFDIVLHIAKTLFDENHDTVEDLLESIKRSVRMAYITDIITSIEDEEKNIKEEMLKHNPNDEYNNETDCAVTL